MNCALCYLPRAIPVGSPLGFIEGVGGELFVKDEVVAGKGALGRRVSVVGGDGGSECRSNDGGECGLEEHRVLR